MFTIFKFTFREAFSRKILLVSLIMAVVFLGLYGTGVHYAAGGMEKETRNAMLAPVIYRQLLLFGLYFGSFIVSFLAIVSTAGIISSEIESGNIQAIIPKPLRRSEIVLGKFLGQGLFLAVYAALMFGVIYMVVHFRTGLQITGGWEAAALFALEPLTLMAVTFLASTLTSTVAGGAISFTLYAVAIVGGMIEQIGNIIDNLYMKNAGIISSLIMPVDAIYRKIVHVMVGSSQNPIAAAQQMGPFGSLSEPSLWMILYTIAYVLVFLGLSVYYFGRRDV
ncbi:MAG: ABC transporter permease [Bacillota bacterium]